MVRLIDLKMIVIVCGMGITVKAGHFRMVESNVGFDSVDDQM